MVEEGCMLAEVGGDGFGEGFRMSGVGLEMVENEWVVVERSGKRLMRS